MRLAQIQTLEGPGGGRQPNAYFIAQQQILGLSKTELDALVTEERINNPTIADSKLEIIDATRFDKLKKIALELDLVNLVPQDLLKALESTDVLSREAIDVFLEVIAERLIKNGEDEMAREIAKLISNQDIVESIEFQTEK